MRPTPLAIAWIVALSGCAGAPKGPFIVLHKPIPAPHVAKRTRPAETAASASASAGDETVPLSPSDKEALFRAFDDYLNGASPQK